MTRSNALVFPPGVQPFSDDLKNTNELVKRLRCAHELQDLEQDSANAEKYRPLAQLLVSESFLTDKSKEVCLLIACCIADILRIFAPEAPYTDAEQLKTIMQFLVGQLRGLDKVDDPLYTRAYYLLENLATVKSLSIILDLEDSQDLVCDLFKLLFAVVRPVHNEKARHLMLELMLPLLHDIDQISPKLLDVICINILEPHKTQNREAYFLASELISRSETAMEQWIQASLNSMLLLGKHSESELSDYLFDLIYELHVISPMLTTLVLPQLEYKVKSPEEKDRLDSVRLLGRLFSEKGSDASSQHLNLWQAFVGRFNDISAQVRLRCVEFCPQILIANAYRRAEVQEAMIHRTRDPDETVRFKTIGAIVQVAAEDLSHITPELLECIKERTLDKKYKVRKEALIKLGHLYRRMVVSDKSTAQSAQSVAWVKNKVLHMYYQTSLEDRLLSEKLLHTCLVPFQLDSKRRMQILFELYASVDDNAMRAFNEIIKQQHAVRCLMRQVIEVHKQESDQKMNTIKAKIQLLSEYFTDSVKTFTNLIELYKYLSEDSRAMKLLEYIVGVDYNCKTVEERVKEFLSRISQDSKHQNISNVSKQFLERAAPVSVDGESILHLFALVQRALYGDTDPDTSNEIAVERGLYLLLLLSCSYSYCFSNEKVYTYLLEFLRQGHKLAGCISIQILSKVGNNLQDIFPEIFEQLKTELLELATNGTVKQGKHAVQCLCCTSSIGGRKKLLQDLFKKLQTRLTTITNVDVPTALSSMSAIARSCVHDFSRELKLVVSSVIVPKIIMHNGNHHCSHKDIDWTDEVDLALETKAKAVAIKFMARFLLGLKSNEDDIAVKTLKLFSAVIESSGDICKSGKLCSAEKNWLMLTAGAAMLKLAREKVFCQLITVHQFITLSSLLSSQCSELRKGFLKKLNRGLSNFKLGPEFMSFISMVPLISKRASSSSALASFRREVRQCILLNIKRRREFLKKNLAAQQRAAEFVPEYSLSYAVYILSHHWRLKSHRDINTLNDLKECLWFLMEPFTVLKSSEQYSYEFLYRLFQNIKQCKDAVNPDDNEANYKMWALADVGMALVSYRTHNFVLKDKDVKLKSMLSSRFFAEPLRSSSNVKVYVPTEVIEIERASSGKSKKSKMELHSSESDDGSVHAATSNIQKQVHNVSIVGKPGSRKGQATKAPKRVANHLSKAKKKRVPRRSETSVESESPIDDQSSEPPEEERHSVSSSNPPVNQSFNGFSPGRHGGPFESEASDSDESDSSDEEEHNTSPIKRPRGKPAKASTSKETYAKTSSLAFPLPFSSTSNVNAGTKPKSSRNLFSNDAVDKVHAGLNLTTVSASRPLRSSSRTIGVKRANSSTTLNNANASLASTSDHEDTQDEESMENHFGDDESLSKMTKSSSLSLAIRTTRGRQKLPVYDSDLPSPPMKKRKRKENLQRARNFVLRQAENPEALIQAAQPPQETDHKQNNSKASTAKRVNTEHRALRSEQKNSVLARKLIDRQPKASVQSRTIRSSPKEVVKK